jgi:formyl-CoA transferase
MAAFTLAEHLGGLSFDPPSGAAGYARLLAGGRQPAPTADGHVAMLPYTGTHWRRFFQAVGRDDLCERYDVDDRHARNARIRELYADMAAITRTLSTDALLALCAKLDIPATRVWSVQDLPRHPHLQAVGLFQHQQHPVAGPLLTVRPPTRFARTPADVALPAPVLGEHGAAILREAGVDEQAVRQLQAQGVLKPPAEHPRLVPAPPIAR